jgi:hypothetical protein
MASVKRSKEEVEAKAAASVHALRDDHGRCVCVRVCVCVCVRERERRERERERERERNRM